MTGLETIRVDAADRRATLVLVHGAWHGAWCWQDGFTARLADRGISTIALSLRGHCGSAQGVRLNRLRMRDYVDDVAEVVSRVNAAPFVAGHSMGGGVVQGLLSRADRPRIAGAALLASMPPRGVVGITLQIARTTPGEFLKANLKTDLGRFVRTPKQVRELFFLPSTPEEIVAATTRRVQSESYRAFLDMLVLDRPKPRRVDDPVLVVGAVADPIFGPKDVAATAAAWGTEAVMLDGIGHDVMLDAGWERTADLLADWVLARAEPA
jgi:pimeloyl-ACP methyl ester carboxylesterase